MLLAPGMRGTHKQNWQHWPRARRHKHPRCMLAALHWEVQKCVATGIQIQCCHERGQAQGEKPAAKLQQQSPRTALHALASPQQVAASYGRRGRRASCRSEGARGLMALFRKVCRPGARLASLPGGTFPGEGRPREAHKQGALRDLTAPRSRQWAARRCRRWSPCAWSCRPGCPRPPPAGGGRTAARRRRATPRAAIARWAVPPASWLRLPDLPQRHRPGGPSVPCAVSVPWPPHDSPCTPRPCPRARGQTRRGGRPAEAARGGSRGRAAQRGLPPGRCDSGHSHSHSGARAPTDATRCCAAPRQAEVEARSP